MTVGFLDSWNRADSHSHAFVLSQASRKSLTQPIQQRATAYEPAQWSALSSLGVASSSASTAPSLLHAIGSTGPALVLGALGSVWQRRQRRSRQKGRFSPVQSVRGIVSNSASSSSVMEADTLISIEEVEQNWEQAIAMCGMEGKAVEDIAQLCALLCCVQRMLGYLAAEHEGSLGSGALVSQAPPLPLVLSWEGAENPEEVYAMSMSQGKDSNLLRLLLNCVKRAEADRRWNTPENEGKELTAKVSLLREFVDISASPWDWIPGQHGLWYSDGTQAVLVYLPQVAEKICIGASPEEIAKDVVNRANRALRKSAASTSEEVSSDEEGESEEEQEEEELQDGPFELPSGHSIFRFETLVGVCPIATLPLPALRTRKVSDEHSRALLYARARIVAGQDEGVRYKNSAPRFALLTTTQEEARARAIIVPHSGAYSNAQVDLEEGFKDRPFGLEDVRRIFILAPVWDCYIDGCGIPEQRCAWYQNMPLDIPNLEQLRGSKLFSELTVEQDEKERSIEVLLPLVEKCLPEEQNFTLVPVFVGGVMRENASKYVDLLAQYIDDPENLFLVAGNVDGLGDSLQRDTADLALQDDGPICFMNEESQLVNKPDEVVPVFNALELFLSVLERSPSKQQLTLSRHW
eukprot:TRINITY_DN22994_c1_g1_i1.p1 TRINITY_DN22994_c1_g1~~TRINITY_DN22994_c1_g1_i1.p1  ORF type:complete len:635 (-),score=115.68 TRINITY_DN22994_c1_g1_i1:87-1991(-)